MVSDIWYLPFGRSRVMLVLWTALERAYVQVLLT
jgi:hypothetical protein